MDSSVGTLGRRGKGSGSAGALRRQRSLEWRNERAYSSSEDELERTRRPVPVDSHVFASLLAQAQQYNNVDRAYRSDDTEDAATTDNPTTPFPTPPPTLASPRSPIPLHRQASPFPLESTNARNRMHYATPQDRHRVSNTRPDANEIIYAPGNKKQQMVNNVTRNARSSGGGSGNRSHRGGTGMTSSGSATSTNSCQDNTRVGIGTAIGSGLGGANGDTVTFHPEPDARRLCLSDDVDEDSPPEPAPPEVPPRGPSLHAATLRRRTEYALPLNDVSQNQTDGHNFVSQQVFV